MCQEYEKILELKMQRGRSVNKVDTLQNLAKAWWLSNKEGNSGKLVKNIQWESAWIKDMIWSEKKQQVKEQEELSTWGTIIRKFGSEASAIAAMERGEIEPRKFVDKKGIERQMYAVLGVTRTPYYFIL